MRGIDETPGFSDHQESAGEIDVHPELARMFDAG
jgi:hypothetical protein